MKSGTIAMFALAVSRPELARRFAKGAKGTKGAKGANGFNRGLDGMYRPADPASFGGAAEAGLAPSSTCLLYTTPRPRDY